MAEIYETIVVSRGVARVGILDRMIAAQAIARNVTLVTMNGGDFSDIEALTLEIWPALDK